MKLITKEIEKKFENFPLYSQNGKGLNAEVLVKFLIQLALVPGI